VSDSTFYYGGFYNDNTKENPQKYIIPAMIGNLSFFILTIVGVMFVGNGVGADAASVPIVCGALPKYCLNYVFAASTAVIAAYLFSTKRTQYAIPVNVCRSIVFNFVCINFLPLIFGYDFVGFVLYFRI